MAGMQETKTLIQLLADLVAFHTVSGEYEPAASCLDYIEAYLVKRGMYVKRLEFNGFPSLVATINQTKRPKVLLQAHLDVVACPDALYNLSEKDGRLVGRGVFDMKFAAAIFLKVVDELKDKLTNYDFGIMLTTDEEIGGSNGVKALLDSGYGAKVCILPDGGDLWQIETTHKGAWIAALTASGKSSHGSRPWEGDNAIHRLIDALSEIKELFKDQHVDSDTLSINKIIGGTVVNQVADKAEAILDMRFLSNEGHAQLQEKIVNIADCHGVKVRTMYCIMVSKTNTTHPLVASFLKIAEKVHGKPLGKTRSLGTSDAHFFAKRGIPAILVRPEGGCAHGDDEWISKDGFEKYYQLVKAYVQKEAQI